MWKHNMLKFSFALFVALWLFFFLIYRTWTIAPAGPYVVGLIALYAAIIVHASFHAYITLEYRSVEVWLAIILSFSLIVSSLYGHTIGHHFYWGCNPILCSAWFFLFMAALFNGMITIFPALTEKNIEILETVPYLAITAWLLIFILPWLVSLRCGALQNPVYGALEFLSIFLALLPLIYVQFSIGKKWRYMSFYSRIILIASILLPLHIALFTVYILINTYT